MTPIGTPELVLLLVALGGMTAAAMWAVIELKKPRRCRLGPFSPSGLGPNAQKSDVDHRRRGAA